MQHFTVRWRENTVTLTVQLPLLRYARGHPKKLPMTLAQWIPPGHRVLPLTNPSLDALKNSYPQVSSH